MTKQKFYSKISAFILALLIWGMFLFPAGAVKTQAKDYVFTKSWGICGDCYQFFAFSMPGLYTGCIGAEIDCGGSTECMCRVHAGLARKYTREYLFQKELSFWLGFGYGVFVPGVQLIDPDNRAKLTDANVPFHEKTDLVFGKSLVILNVVGLEWMIANEINNMIGLMNAASHAVDSKEKPVRRVINTMIGTTPYMGGTWETIGSGLDISIQTKDALPESETDR
jgi:hypothetical protein